MNYSINDALSKDIKKLYLSNPAAHALLDNLGSRKRDISALAVKRAAHLTGVDYRDMLLAMRKLAEIGAGSFKVGRKGAKTRVEWKYSVRSLAQAAKGEGSPVLIDPEDLCDDEADEANSTGILGKPDLNEGDVVHEFLLRPDRKIIIVLPTDLTAREAERLAGFMRSLPFEDGFSN